ncbi:MAG: DUF1990 family protein [Acidobacteriaceae bacterium]
MFYVSKPSDRDISQFLSSLTHLDFSYLNLGATASVVPHSYTVDHNRVELGKGATVWQRGVEGIRSWKMFNLGWVQLCWPDAPIRAGSNVAVLVRHFGFYSLNGARIVYVVNEAAAIKRFGFAYGTLADHAESGEERFIVEWNREDDSVHYDLLAFSKPNQLLSRIAFPLARSLQKRFAADSKSAMLAFVRSAN